MSRGWKWAWSLFAAGCILLAVFALFVLKNGKNEGIDQQNTSQKFDFDAAFADYIEKPDWYAIYDLAGCQDTKFEGREDFARYMKDLLGKNSLKYQQVYSEQPDTHRYIVFIGDHKRMAFTVSGDTALSVDNVALYLDKTVSVTVEISPEDSVFINGVKLDEKFVIYTRQTRAEDYLPEGVHGERVWRYMVTGLYNAPDVKVLDQNGMEKIVALDPETGVYGYASAPESMSALQEQLARDAATADAAYAIGKIDDLALAQYFDQNSALYKMLVSNPRNIQKYTSESVEDVTVSQYYRYTDDLYSVRVSLTQKIVRSNGMLKVYYLDKTYFFTADDDGVYRVTNYTTEQVSAIVEQVRIQFHDAYSVMVDVNTIVITPPQIDSEGFLGWATMTQLDDSVVYTIWVLPDGTVLGDLEPMTLYPYYSAD